MSMRAIGVVRKLDQLGRIVIPKELRKKYSINVDDDIEILVDSDTIILQKFVPRCVFCQNPSETIRVFKEKHICRDCWDSITAHGL